MKKQNLTFGQKVATAAFAVALASSSLAIVPTVALAEETGSVLDAVTQRFYGDSIDTVVLKAKFDGDGGNVLKSYDVILCRNGEQVDEFEASNLNVDFSTNTYTVDLSECGYEISPMATMKFDMDGFVTKEDHYFGVGFADKNVVSPYRNGVPVDGYSFAELNVFDDVYAFKGLQFSKFGAYVMVQTVDTGAAKLVDDAIDSIGEVAASADCRDRLNDISAAYYMLPKSDRGKVSNSIKLFDAIKEYHELSCKMR